MARVDKTDSAIGVVRAVINADFAQADWDKSIPVGLNATGKIVKGAGQTGVIGILIPGRTVYKAGEIGDIFIHADIIENEGLVAGTKYYSDTAGVISTTNTGTYIGFTVEADRLIVGGI